MFHSVILIANSIGAYFSMNALAEKSISQAMFISPIVNMERLIEDMMMWSNVTEAELESKKEIPTEFGETLSWEYLCYDRYLAMLQTIQFCDEDTLYVVGDAIDRGHQSIEVVLDMMSRSNVVLLRGNHEQMCLDDLHRRIP